MNSTDVENITEPKIKDFVLANSRMVGDSYLPMSKAKIYSFAELAKKFGVKEHLTSDTTESDALTLFDKHVPFKVLVSDAPYCYAVELNKDNFVHLLARRDYIPKQYLSGVSTNLPLRRFRLEIEGIPYYPEYGSDAIIHKLAEAWKLW